VSDIEESPCTKSIKKAYYFSRDVTIHRAEQNAKWTSRGEDQEDLLVVAEADPVVEVLDD